MRLELTHVECVFRPMLYHQWHEWHSCLLNVSAPITTYQNMAYQVKLWFTSWNYGNSIFSFILCMFVCISWFAIRRNKWWWWRWFL